jgi:hypothetical protein
MKKYFYLMSLMVGLLVCSFGFVACGDDKEDEGKGKDPGSTIVINDSTTVSVSQDKLKGLWYAVDENSANKINVFMINFMDRGQGYYAEFKAKAKNNWGTESEAAPMTWQLDKNTVKFYLIIDQDRMERKADILKLTDNEVTIKRYLDEGTDQITMKRAQNEQEVVMYFSQLVAEKKK